jgi:hypothetical protein
MASHNRALALLAVLLLSSTCAHGNRRPQQAVAADNMPQDEVIDRLTHVFVSKLRRSMMERCRRLQADAPPPEHPISAAVRNNELVDGARCSRLPGPPPPPLLAPAAIRPTTRLLLCPRAQAA